jgi:g-D-glutamyl-meso-diaminopimelate peptidase
MSGTDVMEIQSLLKRMGFNPGPIDGIFGPQTRQAVIAFQRRFGLVPDGIIGLNTFRLMESFLLGYDMYTVRPGDTLFLIASRYGVSPDLIRIANPNIDDSNLVIGQRIKVPYGLDIVPTNVDYTYEILQRNVAGLKALYPFIETGIAGQSVLGRNLFYIRLGKGPNQVFYNAAHHALEWITSPLLMKFIEDFSKAYALGQNIAGYVPSEIWDKSSIYIVPMVNPDGVNLVLNGLSPTNPYYNKLIQWNNGTDFSDQWQANIRGVDLNHNYNAGWEESKEAAIALGITGPGPTRYSGPYPLSEPETRAMVDFTRDRNFRLVLAYHSQGEVIFWNFQNMATQEAREIGEALAGASGYELDQPTGVASYAGFKDWFIKEYRRPGYTVEVGRGKNPLPISQFDQIYRDNLPLLLLASVI